MHPGQPARVLPLIPGKIPRPETFTYSGCQAVHRFSPSRTAICVEAPSIPPQALALWSKTLSDSSCSHLVRPAPTPHLADRGSCNVSLPFLAPRLFSSSGLRDRAYEQFAFWYLPTTARRQFVAFLFALPRRARQARRKKVQVRGFGIVRLPFCSTTALVRGGASTLSFLCMTKGESCPLGLQSYRESD